MSIAKINGVDHFYTEVGAGIPCIAMHGGGLDHTHMHPWLDPLGEILRIVYYDRRCLGRSGRAPLCSYTFPQLCSDAEGLCNYLGIEKAVVMGISMGSILGLQYALSHPERVSHLILIGSTPYWDFLDERIECAKRNGATKEMLEALLEPPPTDDEAYRSWFETILPLYFHRYDPAIGHDLGKREILNGSISPRVGALLAEYDIRDRLKSIQIPTLIAVGRHDFVTPPSKSEILQAGIPHSELFVFEQSGHLPYIEESDLFFEIVGNWLKQST